DMDAIAERGDRCPQQGKQHHAGGADGGGPVIHAVSRVLLLYFGRYAAKGRSAAGISPAALMRTRLRRPVSPCSMITCCRVTRHSFARKDTSSALAAPSTGGALTRIFSVPSCSPMISVRLARGCR